MDNLKNSKSLFFSKIGLSAHYSFFCHPLFLPFPFHLIFHHASLFKKKKGTSKLTHRHQNACSSSFFLRQIRWSTTFNRSLLEANSTKIIYIIIIIYYDIEQRNWATNCLDNLLKWNRRFSRSFYIPYFLYFQVYEDIFQHRKKNHKSFYLSKIHTLTRKILS